LTKPLLVLSRPVDWQLYQSDIVTVKRISLSRNSNLGMNGRPTFSDGHFGIVTKKGINDFVNYVKEKQPQFILIWIQPGLSLATMQRIREAAPKAIIFLADGNQPESVSEFINKRKNFIDVPLINNKEPSTITAYEKEGFKRVHTLYEAAFPKDHNANLPNKWDCFFAGSNLRTNKGKTGGPKIWHWQFPNGKFRFDFIAEVSRLCNLMLLGDKEWPVRTFNKRRGQKYFDLFRQCKIVLGCNHFDLDSYFTRRFFHSGMSGKLFICKRIPGVDMEEILWFDTVEEGLSLIKHYLPREKKREVLAAKCKARFVQEHSWEARFRDFEKILKLYYI